MAEGEKTDEGNVTNNDNQEAMDSLMKGIQDRKEGKHKNKRQTIFNKPGEEVEVLLPVTTTEAKNTHGRRRNSAHTPGRGNLPPTVFGKHEETRDPARIVEERQEREEKK